MVVIIIGREFAVNGLRSIASAEGFQIAASDLGKTKMAAQVLSVSLLLIAPPGTLFAEMARISLWVVVLLAIVSMIEYFRGFWSRIEQPPPAKPESSKLLVMRKERKDMAT